MPRPGFGQVPAFGVSTNGTGSSGSASLGQGMASQQSMPSFSFGQQPQSGGLFGATTPSQSFPPVNGSGAQDSNAANASFPAFGGNTAFNFGASAPSTGFTFSSGGVSSNPFANLNNNAATSSTPTFQPSTNLFSASNQAEKSNIFASPNGTSVGGLFAQPAGTSNDTPINKSHFAPIDDAMHTSPDRSASKSNPGAFSFLNASQPTANGNSLFTKPSSFGSSPTTAAEHSGSKAPTFSFGNSATTPSSPSLDKSTAQNISNTLSPNIQDTSTTLGEDKSPALAQPEKTVGLFGSISRPSLSSALDSTAAKSATGSQLFGGIAQSTKPSFGNATQANIGSTLANAATNPTVGIASPTPKVTEPNKGNLNTPTQSQASATEKNNSLFNFGSITKTPTNTFSGNNTNIFSNFSNATNTGRHTPFISLPDNKATSPESSTDTNQSQVAKSSKRSSENQPASKSAISRLQYLNIGLLGHLAKQDRTADWSSICKFYVDQASQIIGSTSAQKINPDPIVRRDEFSAASGNHRSQTTSDIKFGDGAGNSAFGASDGGITKRKNLGVNTQGQDSSLFSPRKSSEILQNKSQTASFPSQSSSTSKTSETASIFKSIVEQPNNSSANAADKPDFGSLNKNSAFSKEKTMDNVITAPTPTNPFASIKSPETTLLQSSVSKPEVNGIPKANASSSLQPPKFNVSNPGSSFMGQFGQLAAKESEKEKEKRKLEDFDSEEDDEADWERKDAEKQKAKKAKVEAETANAKGMKARFVNGEFIFEKSDAQADSSVVSNAFSKQSSLEVPKTTETSSQFSRPASPATSVGGGTSVFNSPKLSGSAAIYNDNIFAHLSDVDSGAEGKGGKEDDDSVSEADLDEGNTTKRSNATTKTGFKHLGDDARNPQELESDDGESLEDAMRRAPRAGTSTRPAFEGTGDTTPAAKGGLFDRIKMGTDGRPERDASSTPKARESANSASTSNVFGQGSFGKPTSSFGKPSDKNEDHTWKADSPIKFGAGSAPLKFGSTAAPSFSFTPATPMSAAEKPTTSATPVARPFGNLFGTSSATPSFGATASQPLSSSKAPAVGFSFASPKPNGAPTGQPASESLLQSTPTSRATTPGAATDAGDSAGDSTVEGDAPAPDPQQRDLTALSETELREEEILFDGVKGKAMKYERPSQDATSSWVNKGVGPVRLLKGKSNGVVRILMRASPSGKVVINARLLTEVSYTNPQPRTVQVPIMEEDGQMSTWIIRFGNDEDATRFLNACETNKA